MCQKCEDALKRPRMDQALEAISGLGYLISLSPLMPSTELVTALRAMANILEGFLKDPVHPNGLMDPSKALLEVDPTLETHPEPTALTLSAHAAAKTLAAARGKENVKAGVSDVDALGSLIEMLLSTSESKTPTTLH